LFEEDPTLETVSAAPSLLMTTKPVPSPAM
jgi:hypothetical protein